MNKDKVRWATQSGRLLNRFWHDTKTCENVESALETHTHTKRDVTQQCQKHGVHNGDNTPRVEAQQCQIRERALYTVCRKIGCPGSPRCPPDTLVLTTSSHTTYHKHFHGSVEKKLDIDDPLQKRWSDNMVQVCRTKNLVKNRAASFTHLHCSFGLLLPLLETLTSL